MFSWRQLKSTWISRKLLTGMPSLSKSIRTFLRATILSETVSFALSAIQHFTDTTKQMRLKKTHKRCRTFPRQYDLASQIPIQICNVQTNRHFCLYCSKCNNRLTTSVSGMFMGFPVLKEVKIPFFVMGADGSVPFSFWVPVFTFGGAAYRLCFINRIEILQVIYVCSIKTILTNLHFFAISIPVS